MTTSETAPPPEDLPPELDDLRGDDAVTTFFCRLGLEPHPVPTGQLMYELIVGLWRGPIANPRLTSIMIRRKDIRITTKAPLTHEQHAAIAGACAEFGRAVEALSRQVPAPGDTVAG